MILPGVIGDKISLAKKFELSNEKTVPEFPAEMLNLEKTENAKEDEGIEETLLELQNNIQHIERKMRLTGIKLLTTQLTKHGMMLSAVCEEK
ncbi:hypothetical protein CDAR_211001 [Caerostris darwini]|uniref:Uncharacterized protein n=1 Tax=Caerostris darwini TaxID=1538125 RepID=A0AAV4QR37_9ARAC|nr:hypothetical protein CDAR_211001 [Caerostris darwini]